MPKAVIIGATGYVGSAIINSVKQLFPASIQIKGGTRNPDSEKAKALAGENIAIQGFSADKPETLTKVIAEGDTVVVIPPGHADRTQVGLDAIDAAISNKAGALVLISVLTAETDTIFGKQFLPLEEKAKDSGIPYTILRLPFFIENIFGSADPVKTKGQYFAPADPSGKFSPVSVSDIGAVGAHILNDPAAHANKTYDITTGQETSHQELVDAFSKVLEKDVSYVQIPYEAAKQHFLGFGMEEWQVDGVMELFKFFSESSEHTNKPNDIVKTITGKDALTFEDVIANGKGAFQ